MFKTSLLMAIFISTSALAQSDNCLGELCKGETVIDQNNYIGVITGFKDGQILYRKKSYNYDDSSQPGKLSEKIESPTYKVNSFVIDGNNYAGQIKNAFADGRIEYQREGYNYSDVSSNVSIEIAEKDGVKKDVSVIDENNYVGTIKRIFANGKVQYQREGYNYNDVSSKVSPQIPENRAIAKGTKVIDENNYVGVAVKVFNNGKMQYRRNGYNYNDISTKLVPEVAEINNIVPGKNVLDQNNYSGVAKTGFKDSRVEYRRDGYNYNDISSTLAYEIPALKNGTKTGTVVLDKNNYVGTTKLVYNDGRTLYRRKGYNYNDVGSQLSYEVEDHKLYAKNVEYASPSHSIGEVIHFFSNEKVELLADGHGDVCDKLFEEIAEVDGIKAGSEIVLPTMSASVEKIFANSTARIVVEGKGHSVQVLKLEEIDNLSNRLSWLMEIRTNISSPAFNSVSRTGVKKEDYKKLLGLLKTDLEGPSMGISKDEKKKINEFLDSELKKLE